jgi:F-type H+-transporting ATPase subunit c
MKHLKRAMLALGLAGLSSFTFALPALAEEGAAGAGAGSGGLIALAAGIAIAGAAIGAALGQGRAVAAAMESIGRNPNSAAHIQTPMIIGIAFIEALAIYALVIAFFLQGKI